VSDATHTPPGETPAPSAADHEMTRGQFLTAATVGFSGVMGVLLAAPVAGMALGPVFGGDRFEPVFIGNVDEFADGSFTKVVLKPGADQPDAYVRKQVAFVRRNTADAPDRLALEGQEEFTVVSNICMHLGCPVQASASGFVCPCHGGSYDADGARLAGPPVRPLDRYVWERRGDELWAVAIYAIDSRGNRKTHRDPGQHTEGLSGLMYPLQPS
jgi:menaquinol-cytochrome c reductase iron-sulfur subunit